LVHRVLREILDHKATKVYKEIKVIPDLLAHKDLRVHKVQLVLKETPVIQVHKAHKV
jgi:hypothetical protein